MDRLLQNGKPQMEQQERFRAILKKAKQVVLLPPQVRGKRVLVGKEMGELLILRGGSVIVGRDGRIADIGEHEEVMARHVGAMFEEEVDCAELCLVPGLCDGHTHPVWTGDRVHEFALKLAGATYMDIHAMGGGIGFTVRHTREASEDELLRLLKQRLDRMLRCGTVLVEGKSGYGLEAETEMKMLKVLHKADKEHSVDIVSNFCGAHSVPKGSSMEEATRDIVENQIPLLARLRDEGEISPTLIDVFMEKGVFDKASTEKILKAGQEAGLEHNFHGDELNWTGSAELAGQMKSLAVSHLEEVSDEGIAGLLVRPSIAVLLPTTAYILRLTPPPARKMIEAGVPVALGSDFNPNAHCLSMALVMHLACVNMKMTMAEALIAATLNSAASMDRSGDYGSLEIGKWADIILLEADSWEHLIYEMVDPPIKAVMKRGKIFKN